MNYEEKVSTRADVKALFEKVMQNPAVEKYRGFTETKSYGWDASLGNYVKCDGVVWFDNPAYDSAFVPASEAESTASELLDEQLTACMKELEVLQAKLSFADEEKENLLSALATAQAEVAAAILARDGAIQTLQELQKQLEALAEKALCALQI